MKVKIQIKKSEYVSEIEVRDCFFSDPEIDALTQITCYFNRKFPCAEWIALRYDNVCYFYSKGDDFMTNISSLGEDVLGKLGILI